MIEAQQGATYTEQLRIAKASEDLGFGAFFRSDHYMVIMKGWDGPPGPTDAWATLAGLARETSTIRLGTMVNSATFRLPGPLAITVAQVDEMSGGRVELGLGAGWYESEHQAYGIPFPPLGERFSRLEEQFAIIDGLWRTPLGETFDFAGEHYQLRNSPALPKPVQSPRPPLIVGGHGRKRTPALAAKYAYEFNVAFSDLDVTGETFGWVREAAAGRELIYSACQTVAVGADEAGVTRRAEAIHRTPEDLREHGLAGSPAEVVDMIGRFAELGATRMYLQVLDIADLDQLELIAGEVMPQV